MQLKEGNLGTCLSGVGVLNPFERLPPPFCTPSALLIPHSLLSLEFFSLIR